MFTDIHHSFKQPSRKGRTLSLTIVAVAVVVVLVSMVLTSRLSLGGTATTATATERSLNMAGFGSARTLLLASLEPAARKVSQPTQPCSPFASLAACASDQFAAFEHMNVRLPI